MLNKNNQSKAGFTILELVFVIVIIGILSLATYTAFNSNKSTSADARRLSDIQTIRTALSNYYQDVGIYPTLITAGQSIGTATKIYLENVPTNPSPRIGGSCTDVDYVYASADSNNSYSLSFCLIGKSGNNNAGTNLGLPSGIVSN